MTISVALDLINEGRIWRDNMECVLNLSFPYSIWSSQIKRSRGLGNKEVMMINLKFINGFV